MPNILIGLAGGRSDLNGLLLEHLTHRGVHVEPKEKGVATPINTFEDCDVAGRAVAEFIADTPEASTLFLFGPGADIELAQLRLENMDEIVSGMIASSAYLQ
jgi:hypothetical protein